jgi:hypothetical protein
MDHMFGMKSHHILRPAGFETYGFWGFINIFSQENTSATWIVPTALIFSDHHLIAPQ